jgi:hypothetical protein
MSGGGLGALVSLFNSGGGAGGGLDAAQTGLAEFIKEQQMLKALTTFGNTGTVMGTGATQAAGGAQYAKAMSLNQSSDINQSVAGAQSGNLGALQGLLDAFGQQSGSNTGGGATSTGETPA